MAWTPNNWSIVAGEAAKFLVILLDSHGEPLNITGATAIKIQLPKTDGSILEKNADIGFTWGRPIQPLYIYGFALTPAETELLLKASKQSVLVNILYGEEVYHHTIRNALNVSAVSV